MNLESHKLNRTNSILINLPMYPEFAIETIYVYKILKEMATIYARLKNQYNFK